MALGAAHTCLLVDGGVKCWGSNQSGQLGDGLWRDQLYPVDVVDLDEPIAALSAGDNHTCALTLNGGILCWGDNAQGQLGDGTTLNRNRPVRIEVPYRVLAMATGAAHTCVLSEAGGVHCWGANMHGQLGNGAATATSHFVDVIGLSQDVLAITAGGNHTCALIIDGSVKCWGENSYGQLGSGDTSDQLTPVDIKHWGSKIEAITAGDAHTCALTRLGTVLCWGRNSEGQLGDGSTTDRLMPVDIYRLSSGVRMVAAGGHHTCALTAIDLIKCWGANQYGQLGNGATTAQNTPTSVNTLYSQVMALDAGTHHTCATMANGNTYCWGDNRAGQLGDDTSTERRLPVLVSVQLFSRSWDLPTSTLFGTSTPTPTPWPTSSWSRMFAATPLPSLMATPYLWSTPTVTPTATSFRWTEPTVTPTATSFRWSEPTATSSPRPPN